MINKVDRDTARVGEVENEVFDLFIDLDANDDQVRRETAETERQRDREREIERERERERKKERE